MPLNLKRYFDLLCLAVLVIATSAAPLRAQDNPFAADVRPTEPLSPDEEREALVVPAGFRVTLFAAEPQIQKPLNLAFDARGRLWVSVTKDYPFANLEQPGDSIRVLEDTDGDGRADRSTVFVDGLTHPIGLYPYRDGVIAFSIPNIWFFRDTDGDGRCDRREKLLGPFDYSRDTHGLNNAFRRGYDGWVYACHGFNNHSIVAGADGHKVDMQSGNIYRFRPDGSRIEQFTYGQVNPFGMTLDPLGDFYTSDCHTKPITLLMQDGQYPGFGRQHDGLGFVPAVMDHIHGSTAIGGISQYTGGPFPAEYRESLFVGNVMTSRVHRDTLARTGSSVRAVEQPDFVVSRDPWFRPVDTLCGPDGALYVADFYNRIIGHYEVPLVHPGRDRERGRIWRIDYVGDPPKPARSTGRVDLASAGVDVLIEQLNSENVGVQTHSIDQITDRLGPAAAPRLIERLHAAPPPRQWVGLLWSLFRLKALSEADLLTAAKAEPELVRIHAMLVLGATPEWSPVLRNAAIEGLTDRQPLVKRKAAGALEQHPHDDALQPLFLALGAAPADDPHLVHQLKLALRVLLREPARIEGLSQLPLTPAEISQWAEICVGVDSPAAAKFLARALAEGHADSASISGYLKNIARQLSLDDLEQLAALIRQRTSDEPLEQFVILSAINQGLRERGSESAPFCRVWADELASRLFAGAIADSQRSKTRDEWLKAASTLAADFLLSGQRRSLGAVVADRAALKSTRAKAAQALAKLQESPVANAAALLVGHDGLPPGREADIVELLLADEGEARQVERFQALLRAIPSRLHRPAARWLLTMESGAPIALKLLDSGALAPVVLLDTQVRTKIAGSKVPDAQERVQAMFEMLPPLNQSEDQKIAEIREKFTSGQPSADRGKAVFEKKCAQCHQIRGVGKVIGPQLDGIGNRGLDRLLEDVLAPSRNVDEAFRSQNYALSNGRIVTGVFRRNDGELVVLADNMGEEVSFRKDQIEEQSVSSASIMPDGLAENLPADELIDLLGYLLQQSSP